MSIGSVPVEMIRLPHGKLSPFNRMIHGKFRTLTYFEIL